MIDLISHSFNCSEYNDRVWKSILFVVKMWITKSQVEGTFFLKFGHNICYKLRHKLIHRSVLERLKITFICAKSSQTKPYFLKIRFRES